MTKSDQIKVLDDKIKANNAQYKVDRLNAEISAYSSGNLDKYKFLMRKDLGYKPDPLEQAKFGYSPLGKVFTDGLTKKDKESKKVEIFKRLQNIEDNLTGNDNDDNNDYDGNKVGLFDIIKEIKNKGIKIGDDDKAVKEISKRIKELKDQGVTLNNFEEMVKELRRYSDVSGIEMSDEEANDFVDKIEVKDATLKSEPVKKALSVLNKYAGNKLYTKKKQR